MPWQGAFCEGAWGREQPADAAPEAAGRMGFPPKSAAEMGGAVFLYLRAMLVIVYLP